MTTPHADLSIDEYLRGGLTRRLRVPDNLALDKNGNLYIAEDPATAPTPDAATIFGLRLLPMPVTTRSRFCRD